MCLVLIGVRADGHKELVAVGDGYRESTESWSSCYVISRRGMRAPVLAIGDGALGFWGRSVRSFLRLANSAAGSTEAEKINLPECRG